MLLFNCLLFLFEFSNFRWLFLNVVVALVRVHAMSDLMEPSGEKQLSVAG